MRVPMFVPAVVAVVVAASAGGGAQARAGAEAYTATAKVKGVTAPVQIQLTGLSDEADRKLVENALRYSGYPGFLKALRESPEVGSVTLVEKTGHVRYARTEPDGAGKRLVLVIDQPLHFVGGGGPEAKPRAGYEIALVELTVDAAGKGTGRMAAAARVKPGGGGAVVLDNYADEPIVLADVVRKAG